MTTATSGAVPSRSEMIADAAVHVSGLIFVAVACLYLLFLLQPSMPPATGIGLGLYAIGLVATYGCSALYNLTPASPRRGLYRRLDHAAIFVMIAGTYSPFSLIALHGTTGIVLLAGIWCAAALGVAVKIARPGRYDRTLLALYLLMGWSGLIAIRWLLAAVPFESLVLLGIGGVLYSAGVVFHLANRMPYHTPVWHAFVLAASICHFQAVIDAVTAA